MTMWIYPSGDVHLVAASQMQASLRVVVLVPNARTGEWNDASTVDNMVVATRQVAQTPAGVSHVVVGFVGHRGDDPFEIGPATAATVAPSAVPGESFHVVTAETGVVGQADRGVIRVTTHAEVAALFAGDRTLSMFAGASDRVVTVYARFTEGAFEDVTGHPWLSYRAADEAIATIDREGRIQAVAAGVTTVHVTTWDGRFGFDVPVTVRPALTTGLGAGLAIDELLRRTARRKTKLHVLAEGYRDRARFFDDARRITRELFTTQPFQRLADRYHAIGVYLPSPDRGITIGPRLVSPPGAAADERALWEGAPGNPALPVDRLFSRDTMFGLIVGGRLLSTLRIPINTNDALARINFMAPRVPLTSISPDDRRLPRFGLDTDTAFAPVPPNAAFLATVHRYIEAAGGIVDPDDRIAFLVDDEYYGGLKLEILGLPLDVTPMVAFQTGFSLRLHGVGGTAPILDRAPVPVNLDARAVGSRMAHELGHTYQLADEYEGQTRRIYQANGREIEAFENVEFDPALRLPGAPGPLVPDPAIQPPVAAGGLDLTRIKWNVHRIAKLSPSTAIEAIGGNARLTLEPGQARRWAVNERAFVRNSLVTRRNTLTGPRTIATAVAVVASDAAANTVDVLLPAGFVIASLGDAPLLYVPRRDGAGVDLTLIHPAVLAYLATHGPFPKPPNQATWFSGSQNMPAVPGFNPPPVAADGIGLFEGGAGFSHDVFRPSGRCKMRNPGDFDANNRIVFDPFCFVCQYVMVELNDPLAHEALDRDYPGGP